MVKYTHFKKHEHVYVALIAVLHWTFVQSCEPMTVNKMMQMNNNVCTVFCLFFFGKIQLLRKDCVSVLFTAIMWGLFTSYKICETFNDSAW